MAKLSFNGNDSHSLGVELEFGIVDAQTYALASARMKFLSVSGPTPTLISNMNWFNPAWK